MLSLSPTYNSKPSPETRCPISLSPGVTWEHLRLIGFCLQRAQPELHCIVGKAVRLSQPAFSQESEMAQKVCVLQSLRIIFRTFFKYKNCLYLLDSPHTLSRVKQSRRRCSLPSLLCYYSPAGTSAHKALLRFPLAAGSWEDTGQLHGNDSCLSRALAAQCGNQ